MNKDWSIEEEAKRLHARFDVLKAEGMGQAEFARRFGVPGGASMLSQHIKGRRPMNLEAATAYARGFGCALEEISPRLAKGVAVAYATDVVRPTLSIQENPSEYAVTRPDEANVVISNAIGSFGLGQPRPDHEIMDQVRLRRDWVRANLPNISSIDNLAILTGRGDSMAPTFADGDQLLVDRGVREINVDAVFVLSRHNELFIKRVQRRLRDGAIIIKADNPLFEPETIENGERATLDVLGRVVWVWRGAKL